jgi:hypothetical protein
MSAESKNPFKNTSSPLEVLVYNVATTNAKNPSDTELSNLENIFALLKNPKFFFKACNEEANSPLYFHDANDKPFYYNNWPGVKIIFQVENNRDTFHQAFSDIASNYTDTFGNDVERQFSIDPNNSSDSKISCAVNSLFILPEVLKKVNSKLKSTEQKSTEPPASTSVSSLFKSPTATPQSKRESKTP